MEKVLIIAEAGVNHNGDLELAKRLVDVAKESGADIVKFQTAKAEALVSAKASMAEYQKKNIGKEKTQLEMLQELLLPYNDFLILADYCKQKEIAFLSTPFDLDSIEFLNQFNMPFWKIPSGEITNYPYLCAIGKTGKKVVLSTGMSTLEEISDAINVLKENGSKEIVLLHCNTEYPTPMEDVNLKAMNTMKEYFDLPVGYSDHTKGIEVPIAAVARGAAIIEKHFTLDCKMKGPDHKASLEPNELKQMVSAIRNVELAMGNGIKTPSNSELKNRNVARKSIVALKSIKKGEVFSKGNITTKRPGNGISPMEWNSIIGKKAIRTFEKDELIEI